MILSRSSVRSTLRRLDKGTVVFKRFALSFLVAYLVIAQAGFATLMAQSMSGRIPAEPIRTINLEEISNSRFVLVDAGMVHQIRPWASGSESEIDFRTQPGYTNFRFFDLSVGSGRQLFTSLVNDGEFLKIEFIKGRNRYNGSHLLIEAPNTPFVASAEDINLSLALDAEGVLYAVNKDDLRDRFGKFYPRIFPLFRLKGMSPEKKYRLEFYKGPISLRGLEIGDELMRADLQDQQIREGALMIIEEGVDGSQRLADLYSRRNLLTALLGKEDLLTSIILQLKPGGASDEFMTYRNAIATLQSEIGERALEQGADVSGFDEKLRATLASFEGPASIQALGSVLAQIGNDEASRSRSFADAIRYSDLEISPLSRSILLLSLSGKSLDDLLRKAVQQLVEAAQKSADKDSGEFRDALRHLIRTYTAHQNSTGDLLVDEVFSAEFAADISEWSTTKATALSSHEIHLIRLISAPREKGSEAWTVSHLLTAGALVELRDRLNEFAEKNPVIRDSSSDTTYANLFEQMFDRIQTVDKIRSERDLQRVLSELSGLFGAESPTMSLSDLLIAARAIQRGNTEYEQYVREAGILTSKHEGWVRKVAQSKAFRAVSGYMKQFIDWPHGIMLGLMAMSGAFLAFGDNPAFMDGMKWLTDIVPAWRDQNYIPQLLNTWSQQLGLYLFIHAAFTTSASLARQPVGWMFNNVGKNGFKWFCFPFVSFFFQKILGQSNAIYAARNGLVPLTPSNGLQLPSWIGGEPSNAAARQRVVASVNQYDFMRATAERLASQVAVRTVAQEAGMNVNDLPLSEVRMAWEKFRIARYESLLKELTTRLQEVKASGDDEAIAKAIFENEERKVAEAEKITHENLRIKRLAQVTKRRLQSQLSDTREFDFSRLHLTESEKSKAQQAALEIADEFSKGSEFVLWSRDVLGYAKYFVRDKVPGFLNYPLGTFEELRRAMPKTNVGQMNMSSWQGDMLTQYIILGLHSGWPFQEEFSPGGHFAENGYFVRGNPDTPEHLLAQPMAHYYEAGPDGSPVMRFSETEGAPLYMLNTHPQEMVSLSFQHGAYILELNSTNLTEVAAASRVANPYAVKVEVPPHEQHESFMSSFKGLMWSALHVREYNIQRHIKNKFLNIFKFFQPRYLLFSLCLFAFIGGNPLAAFSTFVFYAGLKLYAYAWPWSPLYLGADHHSNKRSARYEEFVQARNALSTALQSGQLETARLIAADLARIYLKNSVKFPASRQISMQGVASLSKEDLLRINEYIYKKPASAKSLNPGLEKFIGFFLGGIPTTVLGISFMILTLSISDPTVKMSLGVLGLAGYGLVERAFWGYDKLMKWSGMDRRIRRARLAREFSRTDALGISAPSANLLRDHLSELQALDALARSGSLTTEEHERRLSELELKFKAAQESLRAANREFRPPNFFQRCALGLKRFAQLGR